ncbi:unnamed protein product [Ambrosiozyma monospora]|uniref:Unnamed protein product n=1 Tax=Ambrosiozyma monospora TaxID=43982 RepID=A0ACB5UCT4_AMBMO|nr:unnamed protein product [Ambrosiozyma monospora]
MITHELSQIGNEDLVYVLEHGRVIESGKKTQLLHRKNSHFNQMNEYELEHQKNGSTDKEMAYFNGEDQSDIKSLSQILHEEKLDDKYKKSGKSDIETGDSKDDNESASLKETVQLILKFMDSYHKFIMVCGLILGMFGSVLSPVFAFCFSKLINGIVPTKDGLSSNHYILEWSMIATGIAVATDLPLSRNFICKMFNGSKHVILMRSHPC